MIPVQQRLTDYFPSGIRASPFLTDYLIDINKVLLAMADIELLLNAPELNTGVYEDFSTQEDSLKVLQT